MKPLSRCLLCALLAARALSAQTTIPDWISLPQRFTSNPRALSVFSNRLILEHSNPAHDLASSDLLDWNTLSTINQDRTRYSHWTQTIWIMGGNRFTWSETHSTSYGLNSSTSNFCYRHIDAPATEESQCLYSATNSSWGDHGNPFIDSVALERSSDVLSVTLTLDTNPAQALVFPVELPGGEWPTEFPLSLSGILPILGRTTLEANWDETSQESTLIVRTGAEEVTTILPDWRVLDIALYQEQFTALVQYTRGQDNPSHLLLLPTTPWLPPESLRRMEADDPGAWEIEIDPQSYPLGPWPIPRWLPADQAANILHYLRWNGHARHPTRGNWDATHYPWVRRGENRFEAVFTSRSNLQPAHLWTRDLGWISTRKDWYPFAWSHLVDNWVWVYQDHLDKTYWFLRSGYDDWACIHPEPSRFSWPDRTPPWITEAVDPAVWEKGGNISFPLGDGSANAYLWNQRKGWMFARAAHLPNCWSYPATEWVNILEEDNSTPIFPDPPPCETNPLSRFQFPSWLILPCTFDSSITRLTFDGTHIHLVGTNGTSQFRSRDLANWEYTPSDTPTPVLPTTPGTLEDAELADWAILDAIEFKDRTMVLARQFRDMPNSPVRLLLQPLPSMVYSNSWSDAYLAHTGRLFVWGAASNTELNTIEPLEDFPGLPRFIPDYPETAEYLKIYRTTGRIYNRNAHREILPPFATGPKSTDNFDHPLHLLIIPFDEKFNGHEAILRAGNSIHTEYIEIPAIGIIQTNPDLFPLFWATQTNTWLWISVSEGQDHLWYIYDKDLARWSIFSPNEPPP